MELNIFTDASITKTVYGETIGCSGAICLENENIMRLSISRDSTNNIAEITAIKLGVLIAIENRNNFDRINIWSDSQWAIFGLTKWIRSWESNAKNYVLQNSSGQDVKNQQIFLSIIKLITEYNLPLNFYHIKGHVDTNSIKSITNAINVFNRSNNAQISREKMYSACTMNNKIDDITRKTLETWRDAKPKKIIRGVINPIIVKENMIRYYNLVTLGGNKI